MMVRFSNVLEQDIQELTENIRQMDREELWHLGRVEPEYAIRFSVDASEGRCASVHDRHGCLIAVFGVSPLSVLGSVGAPWLLGTPLMEKHARDLLVSSREFIKEKMLAEFDELTNNVWTGNTVSIRYLKALGFKFSEEKTNRATGAPYYTFTMEASDV